MEDLLGLFMRMIIIGVAVAAPIGAMGILCIQRTLSAGWRAGLATGAGIATADAAFAAVAAFGITAISELLIGLQIPLRILGGLGLLWLGWRALRSRPREEVVASATPPRRGHLYSSAVGLTLTNPMTIMAFAAIFAGAGLVAQPGVTSAVTVTAGVAAGSLVWWLTLVTGVWAVRHAISPDAIVIINRISGGVLIAFGLLALIAGINALL